MKKAVFIILILAPLALHCQTLYSENFDSLAVGTKIAAADTTRWTTWGHLPGSSQDAPVTDSYSNSPPNSLAIIQQTLGSMGGPSDPVLLLGYHISGTYSLSWSMYVPQGRGALIIPYHEENLPSTDPIAVIDFLPFSDVNYVDCYVDGSVIRGDYPRATWFTASFIFDLDARTATFQINSITIANWAFDATPSGDQANNVLGVVRFMASSGYDGFLGEYYIDDVLFQEGTVGIAEVAAPCPLSIFPNPTLGEAVLSLEKSFSNARLYVHDGSGRIVWQAPWPAGAERYTLPGGALAPGAYVVRVASRASATAVGSLVNTGRLVVMP